MKQRQLWPRLLIMMVALLSLGCFCGLCSGFSQLGQMAEEGREAVATAQALATAAASEGTASGFPDPGNFAGADTAAPAGESGVTTGYHGRLAWSPALFMGGSFGVRVWDMAQSQMVFALSGDLEDVPAQPALSSDGRTLAYAVTNPFKLDASRSQVVIVDLASGQRQAVPMETDEPGVYRLSNRPAISRDGRRLVFVQELLREGNGGFPEAVSAPHLALWEGEGQPRPLTDGAATDARPMLSDDGRVLIFYSDRDGRDGDLYRLDLGQESEPVRLNIASHPDVFGLATFYPDVLSLSRDGRRLAFVATFQGRGTGAFVLDTATGEITRLETNYEIVGVAISGDGRWVAMITMLDLESLTVQRNRLLLAAVDRPQEVIVLAEDTLYGNAALSFDGSALAVTRKALMQGDGPAEIVVMRADGSDVRLVTASPDDVDMVSAGIGVIGLQFSDP